MSDGNREDEKCRDKSNKESGAWSVKLRVALCNNDEYGQERETAKRRRRQPDDAG